MWFKMSSELYSSPAARELRVPMKTHDSSGPLRVLALIDLLCLTADNLASDLQDSKDLARVLQVSPKQGEIIWQILIKHKVLRKGPQGHNAKDWMIEKDYLGDARKPSDGSDRRPPPIPRAPSRETDKNIF